MKKSLFALLALSTWIAVSGCYHYVPDGAGRLAQGTPIRVNLAPPASFELPDLTAHNVQRVDAEVVRDGDDALVVSARWLGAVTGAGYSGRNFTFTLEHSGIRSVELRRVSWWRTAIVLAGGAVGTWLGFDLLGGESNGGGPGDTGGSTR